MMAQIMDDLDSGHIEAYIGGEGNWRKAIYPEYKANRLDKRVPTWLQDVREHLVVNYDAKVVNDIEVDDMCGIRLTELGDLAVCVSLDKDLLTVAGNHYNFVKKTHVHQTPLGALRTFYKQLIMGDSSDNIPSFDGKFRSSVPMFVQQLLLPIDNMTEEESMYWYCHELYGGQWDEHKERLHRNASVLWIQKQQGDKWQVPYGQKQDASPSL